MPRTKFTVEQDRYKDIGTMLRRWQRYWDCTDDDMGAVIGASGATWARRMAKPQSLTIEEIWKAIRFLKVPADIALSLITAGIRD